MLESPEGTSLLSKIGQTVSSILRPAVNLVKNVISNSSVQQEASETVTNNITKAADETTPLKGTQNPVVKAAAAYGRYMHATTEYDTGFTKEYNKIPGIRPDAVNIDTNQFIELKPNTVTGIRQGNQQVNNYKSVLENQTGQPWTGILQTYEPPTNAQLKEYGK